MATARIVINLQKPDALIKQGIKDGSIVIEKNNVEY